METKFKSSSVRRKFMITSLIGFTLVLAVCLIIISFLCNKIITNVMLGKGIERASEIAKHAEYMIEEKGINIEELQKFVEAKATQDNIAYAIIIDSNVTAIAHSDKVKVNKVYEGDEYTKDGTQNGNIKTSRFYADVQNCWTYDIMIPIYKNGEQFGALDVGIPESGIKDIVYTIIGIVGVLSLIGFTILLFLMIFIINRITKSLKKLSNSVDKASDLDLTNDEEIHSSIKKKNEIGAMANSVQNMREKLREVISEIKNHADTVKDSSENLEKISKRTMSTEEEINNEVKEILQGAERQSEDSQHSSLKMGELADNIDNIISSTSLINQDIIKTNELSSDGISIVNSLSKSSQQNLNMADEITKIVTEMDSSLNNITDSIKMINEIASKTNMLALNAAIESARAGEAGRGFSVVSDEIRKLAEQTTYFTEEIFEKIESVQNKSNIAVKAANSNKEASDENTRMTVETEEVFNKISKELNELREKVDQIGKRASDMENKKNIVAKSIDDISALSEETAASMQQISGQSQERNSDFTMLMEYTKKLEMVANELYTEIEKFKL